MAAAAGTYAAEGSLPQHHLLAVGVLHDLDLAGPDLPVIQLQLPQDAGQSLRRVAFAVRSRLGRPKGRGVRARGALPIQQAIIVGGPVGGGVCQLLVAAQPRLTAWQVPV